MAYQVNTRQQQAHSRLLSTLPVTTHLRKVSAEPSDRTLQRRDDARRANLEKVNASRTNAWIEPARRKPEDVSRYRIRGRNR